MHTRITGVPPSATDLNNMANLIQIGNPEAAANVAMNHKNFYNSTLKNWASRWTNVDQTPRVDLNDYSATVIGMIRDDIPFNQVLYGNILYSSGAVSGVTIAPYATNTNDHYKDLDDNNVDLKVNLVQRVQSTMNGITDTAGVLTTRAAGEAFYSAGTNRRVGRFAFMNFLCRDYEALHDINLTDYHVRRDIDRAPGGDSRTFKNTCVGSHAGQDALADAFSYFDFVDDELVHTPGTVPTKVNENILFSDGWESTTDSWLNLWATGQNASLGWRGVQSGNGIKSYGTMLSASRAFSECITEQVYKLICLKTAETQTEKSMQEALVNDFEGAGNYNMKRLIGKTAAQCMGN